METLKFKFHQHFNGKNVLKAIKAILLIVCFLLFASQVQIFFDLYLKNATVLGITYAKISNRQYPSVTLCPEGVLKVEGFPITRREFDQLAFKMVKKI